MSFRKRNIVVARPGGSASSENVPTTKLAVPPGVRPSPLDGRLTTSTGSRSLDSILAGHSGLTLGTSLLVEESGTTDFGSALLRYYAAEGVLQGHHVHVLGMHESWGRELPGEHSGDASTTRRDQGQGSGDKMKIAWRYERLGEFGAGTRDRNEPQSTLSDASQIASIFCHEFDLSKRLILPSPSHIQFIPISTKLSFDFKDNESSHSPFTKFLAHIDHELSASPSTAIHRIIIPQLLSPALYPSNSSRPEHLLQFLHALRGLLRKYPSQLTAITTLPLTLHPRSTGLTKWMELLSDGVLELAPFPSTYIVTRSSSKLDKAHEEPPQGMLKIHRLPIFHEKGGGGGEASGSGDDLAFSLSRRKGLLIKPFSLPPMDEDTDGQDGGLQTDHGKATRVDIEF